MSKDTASNQTENKTKSKRPSPRQAPVTQTSESLGLQQAQNDPFSARPTDILKLQNKVGNRAVQRLLARNAIQAKLTVGPASDKYEQEADQVADRVMRRHDPAPPLAEPEDEEGKVQRMPLVTQRVQRHSLPPHKPTSEDEEEFDDEEDEGGPVQRKAADHTAGFEAGGEVESRLHESRGQGAGLPTPVRSRMESRFGPDFGRVRIHTGDKAVQLNRDLSAQAFTHGSNIYFGAGKYNPGSHDGQHLIAHELTHVVQQGGAGRFQVQRKSLKERYQEWRQKKKDKKKASKSYNVAMGEDLPTTESVTTKYFESIYKFDETAMGPEIERRALSDILTLIDDDTFMAEVVAEAEKDPGVEEELVPKGHPTPDMSHVPGVRAAIKKFFEGADPKADLSGLMRKATVEALKAGKANNTSGAMVFIINNFAKLRPRKTLELAAQATPGMRPERKYLKEGGTTKGAATVFMKERGQFSMEETPTPEDKTGWAAALKELPTVKFLLTDRTPTRGAGFRQNHGWKDGGNLAEKLEMKNDLVKVKKWMGPRRFASQKLRKKVNEVDRLVRIMVEPEYLSKVPRPRMNIHTTTSHHHAPWGYRANAGGGEVDISYNHPMDVVSHEVGHHLEQYLPAKRFHDMHMLLGARHRAAGGDTKAVVGDMGSKSEGRYAGEYTTGDYTSTAYKGGNAEVISMWMQFMSKPKNTIKLIDGDPQHAAVVFRALRPKEYKAISTLRAYDKYLPQNMAKLKRRDDTSIAYNRAKAVIGQYQDFTLGEIVSTGDLYGTDIMKALEVDPKERDRRVQTLVSLNSSVTAQDLKSYFSD